MDSIVPEQGRAWQTGNRPPGGARPAYVPAGATARPAASGPEGLVPHAWRPAGAAGWKPGMRRGSAGEATEKRRGKCRGSAVAAPNPFCVIFRAKSRKNGRKKAFCMLFHTKRPVSTRGPAILFGFSSKTHKSRAARAFLFEISYKMPIRTGANLPIGYFRSRSGMRSFRVKSSWDSRRTTRSARPSITNTTAGRRIRL